MGFMLRAFRYRNYRLFFGGQIVSLTGTWITITATSWLVYRLTGSAFLLGVIGFASQFPTFLLMPFAGIYVDRLDRHRLLIATQVGSMLVALTLAALTLSGTISVPWLIVVSVFGGIVNAFDMPARQAFVVVLVEDKRDLGNAIALNSSMFNAARLVGPSVAGAIIALSNEGWCFLIDGVSYLAVIAALLAMRISRPAASTAPHAGPLQQFREGLTYAYESQTIRSIILLVGFICLVGVPYSVLMPVFAADVLGGGAHTLGFLMTATGGGALVGALWLASRRTVAGLPRNIAAAGAIFSLGLTGFALSTVLWLSLALLVITGFGFIAMVASGNTLLQTIVEDTKRGRVIALFLMAYFGTTPIGGLAAGAVSARIGAPVTMAVCGALCLAGVAWFASRLGAVHEETGPILAKLGVASTGTRASGA